MISNVWYQPQWQCSWCDYLHGLQNKKTKEWIIFPESPCKPDMQLKKLVGAWKNGRMNYLDKEHEAPMKAWLKDQLQVWHDLEPDVE